MTFEGEWDCPVDCRYTVDKSRLANVDAVMFGDPIYTGTAPACNTFIIFSVT